MHLFKKYFLSVKKKENSIGSEQIQNGKRMRSSVGRPRKRRKVSQHSYRTCSVSLHRNSAVEDLSTSEDTSLQLTSDVMSQLSTDSETSYSSVQAGRSDKPNTTRCNMSGFRINRGRRNSGLNIYIIIYENLIFSVTNYTNISHDTDFKMLTVKVVRSKIDVKQGSYNTGPGRSAKLSLVDMVPASRNHLSCHIFTSGGSQFIFHNR